MIESGKNYLITCDNWFVAPDGEQYCAVYGPATIIQAKDALGFTPARSANWFVRIGEGEKSIIIAGCQIHYAIRTEHMVIQGDKYLDEKTQRLVPVNKVYAPLLEFPIFKAEV